MTVVLLNMTTYSLCFDEHVVLVQGLEPET
jgi:hypothetical protein